MKINKNIFVTILFWTVLMAIPKMACSQENDNSSLKITVEQVKSVNGSDFSVLTHKVIKELYNGQENIIIGKDIIAIDSGVFTYCSLLKNIYVETGNSRYYSINGVLFDKNFLGHNTLIKYPFAKEEKTYIIPDDITAIGYGAFETCSSLQNIIIPKSVTTIYEGAFADCSSLQNIDIPKNVTYIGSHAFYGCNSLKVVTISNTIQEIETCAGLYECTSLERIDVEEGNSRYYSIDGVLYDKKHHQLDENGYSSKEYHALLVYPTAKETTECIIPNGVTLITMYAFNGCKSLKNIAIPKTVKEIGKGAFFGCNSLQNIVFKDPKGWKSTSTYSAVNLTDPKENAKFLKDNKEKLWKEK